MKPLEERIADGPIALLYNSGSQGFPNPYCWVVYRVSGWQTGEPEEYREPLAEGRGFANPEDARADYERWHEEHPDMPELERVS